MGRVRYDESNEIRDGTKFCLYVHIAPNNKKYFGITSQSPENRWQCDGAGYKTQPLIWRAIQKYGWDNIQHIVLADNLSKEWACKLEQDLIWKYQTNNPKYGYNLTAGGDGILSYHMTEEQRKRIGDAGRGRHHTEEAKRKMSEKASGRKLSDEHRRKLSESHKGNAGYWTGKHRSAETRQKISQAMKGRPGTHTTPMSEEAKRKISAASKGRVFSEETREKLRQKSLEYWKKKKSQKGDNVYAS